METLYKTNAVVDVHDDDDDDDDDQSDGEERKSSSTECGSSIEIVKDSGSEVDLECEIAEIMVHLSIERDCRICHLGLDEGNQNAGIPIELGCSCKDDLAFAHKHCAETWFKIKGNKICEICGSVAENLMVGNEVELVEQCNEANEEAGLAAPATDTAETRRFWQGHRFLNFTVACMVFGFVMSWLFRFNVHS